MTTLHPSVSKVAKQHAAETETLLGLLTKKELSLLIFFEDCAVNRSGGIDVLRMNAGDVEIEERWNETGFVKTGRIASEHLPLQSGSTRWCRLSDDAWLLAHAERKARAERLWTNGRTWITTDEKRERANV